MASKKMALITGASSGIGRELACIHAERGGDLVIVARREEKLNELKKELESKHGVDVTVITKDLATADGPKELYDEVQAAGIRVDYLINNAGFGGGGKFHERPWEQDLKMINLNVVALAALTRLYVPDFVERNEGRVLNISSVASLMPGPLQATYFATKAFVTSFSNALADELSDTKVTVTALLPGATETEFGSASGMDKTNLFKNAARVRPVCEDGYNAMLAGKLNVISGVSFFQKVLMKLSPLLPRRAVMKEVRKVQERKQ